MSDLNGSLTNSQYLLTSTSSLPLSRKGSSEISKAYRHASQLYLTRRHSEALSVLEALITPEARLNRHVDGVDGDDDAHPLSPIANATTSQRIKVWSLYVTLINSIVDLGSDEGTRDFGKRWKEIVNKARDGEIWEQVVQDGYAGREGAVDAEVVYNIATLLLGQATSQKLNQSRLENYLVTSQQPDLDISSHLTRSPSRGADPNYNNGTSTPKDLSSRLKILELFTLHVLPRNEEWDYARSFITSSDILDEEYKESFLQTLQELQNANDIETEEEQAEVDAEMRRHHMEGMRRVSEARRNSIHSGVVHRRMGSEIDYGIEKEHPPGTEASASAHSAKQMKPSTSSPSASRIQLSPVNEPSRHRGSRKPPKSRPGDVVAHARHLLRALHNLVWNLAGSITGNRTALIRAAVLIIAVMMAFSRKEIRDKAMRIASVVWNKVKGTVGMGVKVSYI